MTHTRFKLPLFSLLLVVLAACQQAPTPQAPTPEDPALSSQALVWQTQTLDADFGGSGQYTSLVLDGSGNPVISHNEAGIGSRGLKLLHCGNATCTADNSTVTLDNTGRSSSLVLDSSGNPVISYYDAANFDLKLVHCGNPNCTSGNSVAPVDSIGDVGLFNSLELDSSGHPVISYFDLGNEDLELVRCGNPNCTSGNSFLTLDSAGRTGGDTSLELDSSDRPVISYYDYTYGDLKLVRCGNATCTSGNSVAFVDDTVREVGQYTSLALDSSDRPVISYFDKTNLDLKLARCGNATCTGVNALVTLDRAGDVGQFTSLVLDGSGRPIISYYDATSDGDLKLIRCSYITVAATCAYDIETVDNAGNTGQYSSLVLDGSGRPIISYFDVSNTDLKLASLVETDATPPSLTLNQAADQADPTTGEYVTFTLTLSEADFGLYGLSPEDVTLGGTAGATTVDLDPEFGPDDNSVFVFVSGMTQSGTVTASVAANTFTDAAGNPNTASTSTDNTVTYLDPNDTTGPSVTIVQAADQSDPTSESPVRFTVVFSEPVTGLEAVDVLLGGTAGATTAEVTQPDPNDPTTYAVAVSGMTQSGTVTASLSAGIVSDAAGNPNTASTSVDNEVTYTAPVVDSTPPVVTPTVTGTLSSNGWYTSDVSVSFAVTDLESGVTAQTGCEPVSLNTDTAELVLTCTATSAGGTASNGVTLKRDATAPTLASAVSPNPVLLKGSATATPNASDALSGVLSQSCSPASTSSVGDKSVACTATDNAGNTATASATYKVVYDFKGFFPPVKNAPTLNQVKAGYVVPFSFTLGGNYGRSVVSSAKSVPISCSTLQPTGSSSLAPEASRSAQSSEQAVSEWSTNRLSSSRASTTVYLYLWGTSRSYKNTCRQFTLTLSDGTLHQANFRFY